MAVSVKLGGPACRCCENRGPAIWGLYKGPGFMETPL